MPILPLLLNLFLPLLPFVLLMTKTITLETDPPVTIKIWNRGNKHFWAYDYPNCKTYGAFKSYQLALADAESYSKQLA